MIQNKYDDSSFFEQYSQMQRSIEGLKGAGEWHILQKMLPDFKDKRVLDLGCGFGWHCRYAADQGAKSVTGIDISQKMLKRTQKDTNHSNIEYICSAIENITFAPNSFDIVISSLAFHYIDSFKEICDKVFNSITAGGDFVFSVEHPIFTAQGTQDWHYDTEGRRLHWPVDHYFNNGLRRTHFLGEEVIKYHKTLTVYINDLLNSGFRITGLAEPEPEKVFLRKNAAMKEELRRPIFLIISAKKAL